MRFSGDFSFSPVSLSLFLLAMSSHLLYNKSVKFWGGIQYNMYKLHKKLKWGKQYIRYLVSYMMILLIPLTILTFFYSSRFMKKFYHEIFETVDLELVQVSTQMDNEWQSMQNIVGQLVFSNTIQKANAAQTPLDMESVINYLSGFCAANPFIQDIILIPSNFDYVVTSGTTCKRDYYFSRILIPAEMSSDELIEHLVTPADGICLPSQLYSYSALGSGPEQLIVFSFPIFTDYLTRSGTAVFLIRDSSFQQLLSQKLLSYQATILIQDPIGNTVVSNGQNMADTRLSDFSADEYIIRQRASTLNQWRYTACLPNKQTTFAQVSAITREFLIAIILILILASFAIAVLQRLNYAPVRRLREKAKQLAPENSDFNELNEISNALDFLSTQNTHLSSRLENNLTAIKNERLYRLLSGCYQSKEDFNLDCSELDLSLSYDYFTVALLMVHTPDVNLDSLAQEIKKSFENTKVYYCLHHLRPNQIILFFNLPDASGSVTNLFTQTQKHLLKEYHILSTAGIGSVREHTDQIAQSYMEAASALDYRFVKGNGTVIQFSEVVGSMQTSLVYPNQEFEQLQNALAAHNEQSIRSAVQNIIQFMEHKRLPLYLARSICFDLLHMVSEQSDNSSVSRSPLELSGMETAQEITELLKNWSNHLVVESSSASAQVSINDVLSYLNENCYDCDFSTYETAEKFGMTLPAFSKFFKDSTGQNVTDYTIALRMKKAKDLMASTSLPLKDIAEQVGYYNMSSFTRRFKLTQGITPSEFRKLDHSQK